LTEIIYIAILCGFVFLAVILDLFACRVVGHVLPHNIDMVLCLEALWMAMACRRSPAGLIHHSDGGGQYAFRDYLERLLTNGFPITWRTKLTTTTMRQLITSSST